MMGDPERVILEISSDEEVGIGENKDDYEWITELLDEGENKGLSRQNSDDVVVVGEVIFNPPKQNLKSYNCDNGDGDDDDCVVLEEDPDKPVEVKENNRGDDDDDLLVVSEKGQKQLDDMFLCGENLFQLTKVRDLDHVNTNDAYHDILGLQMKYPECVMIACRDYPHPRHLCAKFPFGSTPHERHCDQCHCYVCDTLAPCVYWGTGISSVAHCNATDKEKYWKAQRQSTKKSDKALQLVPTAPATSVSVPPPLANQDPGLTRRLPNYLPQNQTFRQAPIRPCSMSSSPGFTRQQFTAVRDKFHNHVVSQQLRNASINGIPRDKSHNVGHIGPQFFTTRTAFKRAGSSGQAFATGRSAYNSSNTTSVPQFGRTHSSVARWQQPCGRVPVVNKYIASSQPNAVSCQSQLHRQPGVVSVPPNNAPMGPSHPNVGLLGSNAVTSQHRLPTQPTLVGVSANYAPRGPEMPSQLTAGIHGSNAVSFQPQLPRQPSLVGVSANYSPMEPAMPSQPGAGVLGANAVSFQSQLPRQPSHAGVSANYSPMEPAMPSQPGAGVLGANAVSFQSQLPRQPSHAGVSTNYVPMVPQIPSQPHVSVCANSASSEVPAFSLPYANSSSSQPHLSTLPSILSEFESFLSSENAVSSQSQVNNYDNPSVSEAQMFSQLYADGNSASSLLQPTSVGIHPEGRNASVNTTAAQYLPACPTNAGTTFGNSTSSDSQLSNQPGGGWQPDLIRQHLSSPSDSHNVSQHGHQSENVLGPSGEDFDLSWETHSQAKSLDNVNNLKPAESLEVSRCSQLIDSPTNLDIQYDDWLVSGPLNILSPEAPPIDSGFFVDF